MLVVLLTHLVTVLRQPLAARLSPLAVVLPCNLLAPFVGGFENLFAQVPDLLSVIRVICDEEIIVSKLRLSSSFVNPKLPDISSRRSLTPSCQTWIQQQTED